ncbi:hypothetical protein AJ87_08125 [Rhizobium yanglingense]|nr:hypothetical protein AJ87_08125 [Rhizobium yanglingense]
MKRLLAVSAPPTFFLIGALGLISTLGQTFVTGLFAPDFQQRFDISLAEIGAGYGIVVALASVTLPLIGPPIWRLGGTAGFAGVVLAGMALSAWGLSAVGHSPTALFLSLFGLRLMARHGASLIMELVVVQVRGRARPICRTGGDDLPRHADLPTTIDRTGPGHPWLCPDLDRHHAGLRGSCASGLRYCGSAAR